MLVPFRQEAQAAEAVSAVFRAGIIPSGMEFMEREAIAWSSDYLKIPLTLPEDITRPPAHRAGRPGFRPAI
ncbi:MAG: FAD-linked oxidase C-terminal domain-containing protein [Hymenobacter sp.]